MLRLVSVIIGIDMEGEDVQEGSSIRLMAPLMQADERWTMNE